MLMLLSNNICLFSQQKRLSFSVFAGPNYSNLSNVINGQANINISDGPNFALGYQLGVKMNYKINGNFSTSTGLRFIDRRSNNTSNAFSDGIQVNGYIKGFSALGEFSYRPENSKLSLTLGGNFETILCSSSTIFPSLNNGIGPSFYEESFKSKTDYFIWNAYAGINFHLNTKVRIGINYERLVSTYSIIYFDEEPSSFAAKGTVLEIIPFGFQLNYTYNF